MLFTGSLFLNFNGTNIVFPTDVANGITLLGYDFSVSFSFPAVTPVYSELLSVLAWFPSVASVTCGQSAPSPINLQANSDWLPPGFVSGPGGAMLGIAGSGSATLAGGGALFGNILKTQSPTPVNGSWRNMGLQIPIPKGGCLALHLDADFLTKSQNPANVEFWLTAFYQ